MRFNVSVTEPGFKMFFLLSAGEIVPGENASTACFLTNTPLLVLAIETTLAWFSDNCTPVNGGEAACHAPIKLNGFLM
jgi:hypothetical protein